MIMMVLIRKINFIKKKWRESIDYSQSTYFKIKIIKPKNFIEHAFHEWKYFSYTDTTTNSSI